MKINSILKLAACSAIAISTISMADNSEMINASRATVKVFATQLKGELVSAMKSGGPTHAIGVCNVAAPEITKGVSADKGMEISRTSLKLRNTNNAPDDWEFAVLESFEQRKAAGEDVQKIEFSEMVESGSGKEFRYMKAIPTGEACLKCHGQSLDEKVSAALEALYPEDQARGFHLGDIRGAFTVRQAIQ